MRVLAYLHNYPPGRLLGGELMTSLLLEALADRGHEVVAYVQEADEPRRRNGVQVRPRLEVAMAGADLSADVLISHPEIVGFIRNRVKAPAVGIVHNLNPPTIDGLRLGKFHLVVANAEATYQQVRHFAPRAMVLHPPTPAGRHPKPAGVGPAKFTTLVNLSAEKGGRLFWQLAEARPGMPFLGVTGGHGRQVHPERLPGNAFVLGQSESMGVVHALTRVLLMPSATETYGMAAAEACLAGIPVIAHPLPGIREALGDEAIWCDRDNPDAWLSALDALEPSSAYARASEIARKRGKFLAERSANDLQRFCEAVEELVGQR